MHAIGFRVRVWGRDDSSSVIVVISRAQVLEDSSSYVCTQADHMRCVMGRYEPKADMRVKALHHGKDRGVPAVFSPLNAGDQQRSVVGCVSKATGCA